jgi:hypothetical protein
MTDYEQIMAIIEAVAKDNKLLSKEESDALLEAVAIISDYQSAVRMTKRLVNRYETSNEAVKVDAGLYICPLCRNKVYPGNNHCSQCGNKLAWEKGTYQHHSYQRGRSYHKTGK